MMALPSSMLAFLPLNTAYLLYAETTLVGPSSITFTCAVSFVGVVLVVVTQILAIALAAILTGVVATAYTAQVQRRESEYEMQVREVLADGIVTEEEQAQLKQMQAKFGMTDEQVEAIAEQVRREKEESTVNI